MHCRSLRLRALTAVALLFVACLPATALADTPDGGPTPSSLVNAVLMTPQDPDAPPPGANVACTPSAAHPRPVVLVHGTGFQMASNFRYLSPSLAAKGYCVFALNYGAGRGPGSYAVGPIRDSAAELGGFIDEVLATTGASEVDIVGHSQGGMMPRWYLKYLGGAAKVHTLIGISPSNHGTDLHGVTALQRFGSPPDSFDWCPACTEQFKGSEFMTELNAGGDTVDGVDYTVIQTRYDEVVTPYESAFLVGPNVTNILLQDACSLDFSDHMNVAYDPIVRHHILNALDPANATAAPCTLVAPGVQ
ncbi:MAG TPA: alpha/beta fold hydrolase [Acidimicrobiales bacterium]|nr:alpha/beta fold hydrolase [Acidimicrobiales bacterium]